MFNDQFTYQDVRRDFVSRLYLIAYTLNTTMPTGAGATMLALPGKEACDWPAVDDFDLDALGFEQSLQALYRYVSYGEQSQGFGDPDDFEEALGRLRMVLQVSDVQAIQSAGAWLDGIQGVACWGKAFEKLIYGAMSRLHLDHGDSLSTGEVAFLADVDERTVRNAMYVDGPARINATKGADGEFSVAATEALRWLTRRSTFAQTVWVGPRTASTKLPNLAPSAITGFLRSQIEEFAPDRTEVQDLCAWANEPTKIFPAPKPGSGMKAIAESLGWSDDRLDRALQGGLSALSTEDINQLALRLHIDGSWLVEQFSRALTVKNALTGAAYAIEPAVSELASIDVERQQITVLLTEAGVKNGYIDIETRHAERLFPPTCFGGRAGDELGQPIQITYDGKTVSTDLRVKSKAFVSPRKRFNGWFRKTDAKAGDRVTIQLIGPGAYELSISNKNHKSNQEVNQ